MMHILFLQKGLKTKTPHKPLLLKAYGEFFQLKVCRFKKV
jgi:hypothetical protein